MSAQCQTCGGRAQLFLCQNHIDELRDTLAGMPRWIAHLAETVHGQTRLGDSSRRSRSDDAPLRVNLRASDLLASVTNSLTTWIRLTCENRGIVLVPVFFIGPLRTNEQRASVNGLGATAEWLAANVNALASDETAGECLAEMRSHVEDIERVINRPEPPIECGPCPTIVGHHRQECGRSLTAKRGQVEVTCLACEQTYVIEQLIVRLVNQTHYLKMTVEELLRVLPLSEENVKRRTLYDWIAKRDLEMRDLCPVTGKPRYLLADVRRLRSERPTRNRESKRKVGA